MSGSTSSSSQSLVTRGGTIGTANVLVVQPPWVWIALVNAAHKMVRDQDCTITNENDPADTYPTRISFGTSPKVQVLDGAAPYRIAFPAFGDDEWFRPRTVDRYARIRLLTFCRLKYRATVIDELGLPVTNTQLTVTFNDATTATPTTDGFGRFSLAIQEPTRSITSITFADCHESGIGTAVQTGTGTHLAPP